MYKIKVNAKLKKNKISKNWVNKQRRDIYVRQSKIEGFRSRAVYKLKEINQKFKILKNGQSILDLGGAPGSWSQYLSKNLKNAKLLTIDLLEIEQGEVTVLSEYLPKQLNDEDTQKVCSDIISSLGASSIKDMGKVIGELKKNMLIRLTLQKQEKF